MRSILFLLVCLLIGGTAHAGGSDLSHTRQGFYYGKKAAPVLGTAVEVRVTGVIARTKVTQIFKNPSRKTVEGIYTFPLPEAAAVDTLQLKIGDRVIPGILREKAEARQDYQAAKETGEKASLIEQRRPDVFTASIANVGPGETVEIAIEMQQVVRYEAGKFALRFPLIVAPRGEGRKRAPAANPFAFHADLDPGFPLAAVESPTHAIAVEKGAKQRYAVDLRAGVATAGRDLVLEWQPAVGGEPRAFHAVEEVEGERYGLLMVMPPDTAEASPPGPPREVTFILDTSDSMAGTALEQARQAVLLALDRLRPEDRFNILQFGETASGLFGSSAPATPEALEKARAYVAGLRAKGGTDMRSALLLAVPDGNPLPGVVRQVVLVTDGQVETGDETFCLCLVKNTMIDRRVFPVALGEAPNVPFLRRMAELGRGSFTAIPALDGVAEGMGKLFSQLESPVLHDLTIRWVDPASEIYPERIPDLYRGEPLVVVARLSAAGPAEVSGKRGEEWWGESFPEPVEVEGAGIAKLWARTKARSLVDSLADGADAGQVRRTVTELGLRYGLVTEHTSLAAVDEGRAVELGTVTHETLAKTRAVEAEVTVQAESPLLDSRRVSTGLTVSPTELEKVPSPAWSLDGIVLTDLSSLGSSPAYYHFESLSELAPEQMERFCYRAADPGQARAHRVRAEALVEVKKLEEAEAEYVRALAYDRGDEKTWRGLKALGKLAGFSVNRQMFPPCPDTSTSPALDVIERFIRQVVIVR